MDEGGDVRLELSPEGLAGSGADSTSERQVGMGGEFGVGTISMR
jgi:hypothetical protein